MTTDTALLNEMSTETLKSIALGKSTPKLRDAAVAALSARVQTLTEERDRETELRRKAEKHNGELREYVGRIPYSDEWEDVLAERDAAVAARDEAHEAFHVPQIAQRSDGNWGMFCACGRPMDRDERCEVLRRAVPVESPSNKKEGSNDE